MNEKQLNSVQEPAICLGYSPYTDLGALTKFSQKNKVLKSRSFQRFSIEQHFSDIA